jgi:predicted nucleotidyltransferase
MSLGSVQYDLKSLVEMGLVKAERDGNRLYYSAVEEHPLYANLADLVRHTSGVFAILRDAIGSEHVRFAYVFGSVAAGKEKAGSDIDLMVIGSVSLRTLVGRLSGVAEKLGREINPHCMTETEYFKRCEKKDHFISSVVYSERKVIVGDERELRRLEKEWMA